MSDDKKIISDEDWKSQAKQEKVKLSDHQESAAGAGSQAQAPPPANFLMLINALMLQALMYMGKLSDPNDEQAKEIINMDLAKHHIDLLQVLDDKTKGNLTDEEKQALSMALHELRMHYVQVMSR